MIMKHYEDVLRHIDRLEAMVPTGFLLDDNWDFKAIWQQIKITGAAFKGVRFPTKDEHQEAWSRFQNLVQKVKDKQNERRSKFKEKAESSEKLRDSLIRRAENALPDSGLGDLILTLATGGINIILEQTLDMLLGPFDRRKEELIQSSRALKAAWDEFSSQKGQLLRDDKNTVYHALKSTQEQLDELWAQYKEERQSTLDAFFQGKRQRHAEWRERTLANIRKNQERKSRLEGVLDHKRGHLNELHDRLADAWSDDYRSRVEGWISEEEAAINDIEGKIYEINGWISEDLAKLDD